MATSTGVTTSKIVEILYICDDGRQGGCSEMSAWQRRCVGDGGGWRRGWQLAVSYVGGRPQQRLGREAAIWGQKDAATATRRHGS